MLGMNGLVIYLVQKTSSSFWGPNAVFNANPAVLAEGAAGAIRLRSTSTTAITISGRDKFIQTLRLDKLSQWIANGRVGRTLLAQRQMPLLGQVDTYFKASRISSVYNLTSNGGEWYG